MCPRVAATVDSGTWAFSGQIDTLVELRSVERVSSKSQSGAKRTPRDSDEHHVIDISAMQLLRRFPSGLDVLQHPTRAIGFPAQAAHIAFN